MTVKPWSDNAQVCKACGHIWEPECIREDFCPECDSEDVSNLKLYNEIQQGTIS